MGEGACLNANKTERVTEFPICNAPLKVAERKEFEVHKQQILRFVYR